MLFNLLFKKRNVKSSGAVLLVMLCATILSCARNNGTPTEIGTPIGDPVSATIDASGGTLASADGLFEVIVPPGAVSSATDFEIQEVTNKCFGGLGNAFVIRPADIVFNDDITLVFHYGNVVDEFIDFSTLRMAIQDDRQIWMAFKDQQVDSVAKTISIKTTSFSPFAKTNSSLIQTTATTLQRTVALLNSMRINPEQSYMKLNQDKDLTLEVNCPECFDDYDPNDKVEDIAPLVNWVRSIGFGENEWEILDDGPGDLMNWGVDWTKVIYYSPESLPDGHDGKVRIKATKRVKQQNKTLTGVAYAKINIETNLFRFKLIIEEANRVPVCANDQSYKDQAYFTFTINNNTFTPVQYENFEPTIGDVTSNIPGCIIKNFDLGNTIDLVYLNATVQKVTILNKVYTSITLNGQGTSTEPTYFYDCGENGSYRCPDFSPILDAYYGMTFYAEDPTTYKQTSNFQYEILRLE